MNDLNVANKAQDHELQAGEQAFLQLERRRIPDKFKPVTKEPGQLLRRIGITAPLGVLPKGFVKYSPLDFIVEEIIPTGDVISASDQFPMAPLPMDGVGTIYADLVKIGVSTLQAVERIAAALNIPVQKIGYAGIKDAGALTAQRISLRTVTIDQVRALSLPNIILRNICEGKGAIQVGDLKGNRFTLFVRTEGEIGAENFDARMKDMKEKGVVNFFGIQRFGSPRFISHLLGMLILQGEFEEAVKLLLVGTSEYEWPYVTELRLSAKKIYGDWAGMAKIYEPLPYTFRNERLMLELLERESGADRFVKALSLVPYQINMWARAYSSYLSNLLMSQALEGDISLPDPMPLFLSLDQRARNMYALAREHGTDRFMEKIRAFPFLHISPSASIQVFVDPVFHSYKIFPGGVALCFDLPKGAYATTVLAALFLVESGIPVPEWVDTTEYDTKEVLGVGSMVALRGQISAYIKTIMERKTASTGEESPEE